MNARIYELAEQAAEFTDANEFAAIERRIWDSIFREKFAELIIAECAGFLRDTLDDHFAAEQLEQHFGVE